MDQPLRFAAVSPIADKGNTMTKAELIERVASRKDLPRTLTKKAYGRIIDAVFTEVGDYFIRARANMANPPRLSYPGFGTFTKRRRNSRTVRNPQTGAPIAIPAQCTVVFTPGQDLKNLINRVSPRNAKSAA
jgi:DNA-binding protein HU-beta